VSIVTGWTAGFRFLARTRNFSVLHIVQTGSAAHSVCYRMGTGVTFSKVKAPGREADHSPQSSAKVRNGEAIPILQFLLYSVVLN
jgi:hypothetical protein